MRSLICMNFTNGGSIMNEFVDMHVHSKFSIDGMSTMEDYCLIAGKTGTRVICFTEHVDFNSAEKNLSIVTIPPNSP